MIASWGWGQVDTVQAIGWQWALKFAWLPCKMDSGDCILWKNYYHGVRLVFGPAGESPVVLHQFLTAEEFIWKSLQES